MNKWFFTGISLLYTAVAAAADIPAVLQWAQRVELAVPVSGVVQTVDAEVGQRVKKGQVLLSLDARGYRARVAESQALVAKFQGEAAEAKRNLARVQELYDRTVIAATELDQAKLRHTTTQAQLDEARARAEQERKNLNDSVLRAPFDAVVVARLAEPGQAVASGLQPQPLLVLAKADEMLARLKLYDTQLERLKPGQAVTVEVGRQNYSGKIKSLGLEPVSAKDGVVYQVDVAFPVSGVLRAGAPAIVKLP